MGDDFGDAAYDDAEKQGMVVKSEDADADEKADDDADFGGGVAEGGKEELLVAVQEDVGGVAYGEEEEGGGHELEADAQKLVLLWIVFHSPGGEELDVEVWEAGDGGAYKQQQQRLEGEGDVGKLPGGLFVLLLLFLHEDGEEGGVDEFLANEEEAVDNPCEGDNHDGFVDGGVEVLGCDFRLNEPCEFEEDVSQADQCTGFEDAVCKACFLVLRCFHYDDSLVGLI